MAADVWGNVGGIGVMNCNNLLIQNNFTDYWVMTREMNNVAIRNNTIGAVSGIAEWAGLELGDANSNFIFSGNTILGGQWDGIAEDNRDPKQFVYWAHNTIQGMVSSGALLSGDYGQVVQQYFYANTFTAGQNSTQAVSWSAETCK